MASSNELTWRHYGGARRRSRASAKPAGGFVGGAAGGGIPPPLSAKTVAERWRQRINGSTAGMKARRRKGEKAFLAITDAGGSSAEAQSATGIMHW